MMPAPLAASPLCGASPRRGRAAAQQPGQLPHRHRAAARSAPPSRCTTDRAFADMFDRAYAIVCRDAAVPVGQLYVLRAARRRSGGAAGRAPRRAGRPARPARPATIEGLGPVETLDCRLNDADVAYRVYLRRAPATRSTSPRAWPAMTARSGSACAASSPTARSTARSRSRPPAPAIRPPSPASRPARSIRSGRWPRPIAATMPATMPKPPNSSPRSSQRDGERRSQAEALVNEALQKSNLGRHAEADSLFARAEEMAGADPVTARRLRNYRAMHLLNQGLAAEALAELDRPMPAIGGSTARSASWSSTGRPRGRLSAESPGASRLRGQEGLTEEDKAQILDGQALQLRGTVLRLQRPRRRGGRAVQPGARPSWSRSAAAGSPRRSGCARRSTASSPTSPRRGATRPRPSASIATGDRPARDQLSGLLGPAQRQGPARRLLCAHRPGRAGARPVPRHRRRPMPTAATARRRCAACSSPISRCWPRAATTRRAVADLFAASQVLVRPGVAQTQAVLARELSGGSDEAARLFRQSVTLTRDIERGRIELARLEASRPPTAAGDGADRRAAGLARRSGSRIRSRPRRGSPHFRATGRSRAARSRSPTCSACSGPARPITR